MEIWAPTVQATRDIETGNKISLFYHSFSFNEASNGEVNYADQLRHFSAHFITVKSMKFSFLICSSGRRE